MDRNFALEIAQLIGQPINTQLPVPVEIQAIADTFTAQPGEKVYRFTTLDTTADVVLNVNTSTGAIVTVKRDGVGDAEMTFQGLNSKLEYVLVDAVLASPDTDLLSRRKESITRAMDKREVYLIVDAILNGDASGDNVYFPVVNAEELGSGADIYDVIVAMKHKVEDYGDGYVLLCASDIKEDIDNYDKAINATNVGGVSLPAKLKELGIEVIKMFGKVSSASNEAEVAIMPAGKMILIAKNSRMSEGKPIKFVRRLISPEIAKLMGATVDNAQRALIVNPTPVNLAGVNTLAYGIYGYESIIFCITNPKMIVTASA